MSGKRTPVELLEAIEGILGDILDELKTSGSKPALKKKAPARKKAEPAPEKQEPTPEDEPVPNKDMDAEEFKNTLRPLLLKISKAKKDKGAAATALCRNYVGADETPILSNIPEDKWAEAVSAAKTIWDELESDQSNG